jgi:PAS domain S-box-containing protein
MSRAHQSPDVRVRPYYDRGYEARTDDLEATLEQLSAEADIAFGELTPLDRFGSEGTPADGAVVFAADADSVPDRIGPPTVWVTPDPDAAGDAVAAGARDAVTWEPGAGLGLLETKLPRVLQTPAMPDGSYADSDRGPRAESALRTVERVDDGILEVDDDDRITYLNDAAASVLDADRRTLRGRSVWTVLSERALSDVRDAVRRARTSGTTTTTDVVAGNGRRLDVTLYPDGERLSVAVRDTEKRRAETDRTMYEHLVKTVGDAVYILDEAGRFTFVNDALCEMTGYDRDELLGSSVHLIKDDRTVAEAEDALRDLLREHGDAGPAEMSIAKLDVELVRKDGSRIPCTDRMTLRPLEDGSFSGTVGTLRDVSRQRRREQIFSNLLEATQNMVAAETTADVAGRVVDVATDTIDADGAGVREYDPATDTLVPVSVSESARERLGDRPVYDADEGPVGTAFTEGRTVEVDDPDHLETGGVGAVTYLPIGDTRVLSVTHERTESVTDDERRFLELLTATAESVFDRVERDQERRRYEAVVETADDMLFTLDAAGTFTLVTESFAAMLGARRSELVGTPIEDVVVDDGVAELIASPPAGSHVTETELLSRDGIEIPTRISVSPISETAVDGVVGTVQDIRELRLAEQEASRQRRRFTELFGSLTDPLVELSFEPPGPTVVTANDQFVGLADCSGSELQDASVEAVAEALPEPIADALEDTAARRERIEREIRVRTDAGVRFYLVRSVPYRSGDGERAFVVLTDITEVKQQGTHLRVLHRLLRHNLRNQTNVIHGRAELISAETADDRIAAHADRIEDASRALLDTSETAQSIQRILRADQVDSDPLPVGDLPDRLEYLAASVAPDTDIRVDIDTDEPVPYDEPIESALTELLDNAVEYGTPADDDTISVTVTDREDGGIRIAVADDGPGIPDAEWSVVAGDREITQLQHASGLGLWLAKWVADRYGGDLELVSSGADGTTVAIDLPNV